MPREQLIQKHGGFRRLKSFQIARLVYDVTVRFTERYIDRRSRTRDQMVQAARSGVQNIAEGSQASGTSKKMELKLTNVARASLEELRLDYEDFLRQRGHAPWPADEPLKRDLVARRCQSADDVAAWIGEVHRSWDGRNGLDGLHGHDGQVPHGVAQSIPSILSISSISSISSMTSRSSGSTRHRPTYAEIAANAALVLIGVATALLDRQITAQAAAFERDGGFTERLYRARQASRRGA